MRIGIVTLYRGYNYGTSLQAYALKTYIASLGYDAQIIWTQENTEAGRDIRLDKMWRMFSRMVFRPTLLVETLRRYKTSLDKPLSNELKKEFVEFAKRKLDVQGMNRNALKAYAADSHTIAVVCGSDQIWNAVGPNVDPLYYLQFAPKYKRVAYAPSFGGQEVPDYNKKMIASFLKSFSSISVRETQGADIVKELTGREVPVLVDPTLLIDWKNWKRNKEKAYIVAYFLDEPSLAVVEEINRMQRETNCSVIAFPYRFTLLQSIFQVDFPNVGPEDFVTVIGNASCVFTDSFHGTAFAINLEVPFWTFARNNPSVKQQVTRITSLLNVVGLPERWIDTPEKPMTGTQDIDYAAVRVRLNEQRERARVYLQDSFNKCKELASRD